MSHLTLVYEERGSNLSLRSTFQFSAMFQYFFFTASVMNLEDNVDPHISHTLCSMRTSNYFLSITSNYTVLVTVKVGIDLLVIYEGDTRGV